ncbi:MAG TPA: YkgJ family cysteine cluster protein [Tepidisphaeraceae bacterium]|nr:YkgJ family cysteine cluster protein [Tepidisphaeraceae bacterium]
MPLRLAILGASPCPQCRAACCTQNGHAFAVLLQPHEYARFAPFAVPLSVIGDDGRPTVERVLPYTDTGRCQFLDPATKLCAIYDDRPQSCRNFECTRFYNQFGVGRHHDFLGLNPDVRELLERV